MKNKKTQTEIIGGCRRGRKRAKTHRKRTHTRARAHTVTYTYILTPTRKHAIITSVLGPCCTENQLRNEMYFIYCVLHIAVVQSAEPNAGQQEKPRDGAAGQQFPTASAAVQSTCAHQHRFQPEKGNSSAI